VYVTVAGNDNEVSIAIHNRGPLIPEEQLDGLFNAMKRQGENAPASGPSGNLGLGLYIADQIVCAHKGRIEVESTDAHGTTFTVFLPRAS